MAAGPLWKLRRGGCPRTKVGSDPRAIS